MIKITMIAPYEEMIDLAKTTFREHNEFEDLYGSVYKQDGYELEGIVAVGQELSRLRLDSDVILARGIIAELIKSNTKIPVVDILESGKDLIRCLYESKIEFGNRKVGIVGSKNIIFGAEDLAEMFNLDVKLYHVKYEEDIPKLVDLAANEDCEVIIGGTKPCGFASKIGLKSILIKTNKESLWKAFTEAKRVAYVSRMEQEKAQLFKAILEYSREGIIAVDKKNTVSVFNSAAVKIFKIQEKNLVGSNFKDIVSNSRLTDLLSDETEYFDEILRHNETEITVNKVPIMLKDEYVGNLVTFQNVKRVQELEGKIREKIHARGHVAKHTFRDIIGDSEIINETIKTAKRFSSVNSNILIIGETGTGKELFAQSIHNFSPRKTGPFVAVNCAALPENLLESELFGYAEGAFTGAAKGGKLGLFELAHKGTIFLDEISELPLNLQVRLLRVIQEKEIMRLGHDKVIPIDVRIISASNKDLCRMTEQGEFRQDLYYRLDVLKLNLPSLKERKEDIPLIVDNFISHYNSVYNFKDASITEQAKNILKDFDWPGNVRELCNICERLVVLSQSKVIDVKAVQSILIDKMQNRVSGSRAFDGKGTLIIGKKSILHYEDDEDRSRKESITKSQCRGMDASNVGEEKQRVKEALESAQYNRKKAAAILGISKVTLWRKMKEFRVI